MTEKIRVPLSKPWIDDLLRERDELRANLATCESALAMTTVERNAAVNVVDELRADVERLRDVAWKHGNRADEAVKIAEKNATDVCLLKADYNAAYTNYVTQRDEAERLKAALDEIGDAYRKIGEAPNSDIRDLARAHLFSVLLLNFGHPRK